MTTTGKESAGFEIITPEMAKEYLTHNTQNRKLRASVVSKYVRDIINDEWECNGQSIVFDEDNKLKDGQHRLTAIMKAGVPEKVLVARGVSRDCKIYDRGLGRKAADVLKLEGYEVNTRIIGAINLDLTFFKKVISPTDAEIENTYINNCDSLERSYKAASIGSNFKNSKNINTSAGILTGAYMLMSGLLDEESLSRFARIVNTGITTKESEYAAITFRNDLISNRVVVNGAGKRPRYIYAIQRAMLDFANGIPRTKSYIAKRMDEDGYKYEYPIKTRLI